MNIISYVLIHRLISLFQGANVIAGAVFKTHAHFRVLVTRLSIHNLDFDLLGYWKFGLNWFSPFITGFI